MNSQLWAGGASVLRPLTTAANLQLKVALLHEYRKEITVEKGEIKRTVGILRCEATKTKPSKSYEG